jgi:nucleoside-diphosphate-sugar epimerase
MSDFWKGKRVICTGGTGFLGSHLVPKLKAAGAWVSAMSSKTYDLRDEERADALMNRPCDVLFHLAANVGGIGYNQANPATLLWENAVMGLNVLRWTGARTKAVVVGTTCGYPRDCPVPFREEDFFSGYPERTNAPYGVAKRLLLAYLVALGKERGLDWCYAIPTNLYGERDCFDPERSHVIPALMRKMAEDPDEITVWGTGDATRDFLYAGDCAEGLMALAERGRGAVNLGSDHETSIRQLVWAVAHAMDWQGDIKWDGTKPDGQPRRRLDILRARCLGWEPRTSLADGLRRTANWYTMEREHGTVD